MEKATFGAGCFWHVEYEFSKLKGVLKAESGYMGGKTKNPTYKNVCTNETGHAEVVQVTFDPKIISYKELLESFWNLHNPTTKNRQGPDIGSQYRSVIFYHNLRQKETALRSLKELEKSGKYKDKLVTQLVKASTFYRAEEYHQKYFEKHKAMGLINKLICR